MRALTALPVSVMSCGCSTSPATDALEIRHVTVIDPQTGVVTADRCIRISGDTITGIGDCAVTPDVTAVDARSRWVIPGLWDMHVHTVWHAGVYPAFFEAFVRFGVVGVRDMGGDLDILTATDWQDRRAQFVRERALTVRAIREGALVLAGSDAGDLFVPPGASLHDELRLLVAAGMSEMQALRAATADATALLGLDRVRHPRRQASPACDTPAARA